jgi:hypothetical protein
MDNTPSHNIEHIYKQYDQMHQCKREWEKYVWQSPIILATIIAGSLAWASTGSINFFEGHFILSISEISIGLLCFVIAYWTHRSRVLLRITEKKLIQLEEKYFIDVIPKYPINLNLEINSSFDKLSSTKMMVWFMFFISGLTLLTGIIELCIFIIKSIF